MRQRGKTVLLACLLFALSGAALAYNLWTADGGDIAVSISDLVDQMRDGSGDIAVGAKVRENTTPTIGTTCDESPQDSESPDTARSVPLPPVVRREES